MRQNLLKTSYNNQRKSVSITTDLAHKDYFPTYQYLLIERSHNRMVAIKDVK